MVPLSGFNRVVRILTVVVLPAPLGPSNASTVPCGTARSMPFRTCVFPNALVIPCASTIAVATCLLSVVEDRQVELAQPRWVGEDVDLDDPAAPDREAQDRKRPPARRPHGARGAVEERWACI